MPAEPYLIAHLVHGEPAFDIAICCTEADGWGTYTDPAPWWIIPTSGHRAYPYWEKSLSLMISLCDNSDYSPDWCEIPYPPTNHPDHYQTLHAPKGQGTITAADLASRLGLIPRPTIRRR